VLHRKNTQIIIYDTPGVVSEAEMKKHNLDKKFISSCRHSIQHSDVVAILHDISNRWTRSALHPMVLSLLEEYQNKPSFLVLNKVDLVRSKKILLEVIRTLTCGNISLDPEIKKTYRKPWDRKKEAIKPDTLQEYTGGYPNFQAIFLVSALKGDGIEQILDHLSSIAVEKPWEFRNNEKTDQKPEDLIEGFVRARLLDYLPNEIPYKLKTEIEYFAIEKNKIYASVLIYCPNERHEKLLCGAFDGKLRQITDRVTSDIIEGFHMPVTLTISTQVDKKKSD
jgi:GTPase